MTQLTPEEQVRLLERNDVDEFLCGLPLGLFDTTAAMEWLRSVGANRVKWKERRSPCGTNYGCKWAVFRSFGIDALKQSMRGRHHGLFDFRDENLPEDFLFNSKGHRVLALVGHEREFGEVTRSRQV